MDATKDVKNVRNIKDIFLLLLAASMIIPSGVWAAEQTQTTTRVAPAEQVEADVLELTGVVRHRTMGQDQWQVTKKGDKLGTGIEIRTGVRSSVLLKLHETVVLKLKSLTRVGIDELFLQKDLEKSRVALRYGTVRAGIIEGRIKSNFEIVRPTAVLSREGTWGIEFSYDPASGRWRASLDTEGLARLVQIATGRRMGIQPGQYVTDAMQRWIKTAVFDVTFQLNDLFGTTRLEKLVQAQNPGGAAGVDPTGTFSLHDMARLGLQPGLIEQLRQQAGALYGIIPTAGAAGEFSYKFGNFGTGLVPASDGRTGFDLMSTQKTCDR